MSLMLSTRGATAIITLATILAAGCGSRSTQPTASAAETGTAPAPVEPASVSPATAQIHRSPDGTKLAEGVFINCVDPKVEEWGFELWDSGDFEFHNGQVNIEGAYELRGSKLIFKPSDKSKDWEAYTGIKVKELEISSDFSRVGTFTCRKTGE